MDTVNIVEVDNYIVVCGLVAIVNTRQHLGEFPSRGCLISWELCVYFNSLLPTICDKKMNKLIEN